ncbi:hypothetical protein NRB56_59630 [Nocardia sp. RB56]|uniref:Uncharacterized protein n=1 Tax=Nocardia aurantia TaxID=2585199 RepID=A0A7K0DX55_9NOCA|nr:hypothetical protein [Nocardia aurantia]
MLRVVPRRESPIEFALSGDRQRPHGRRGVGGGEALEEFEEPRVVVARLGVGVEVRVGLEVDAGVGAALGLVEVDAQILDRPGRQHMHLSRQVTQGELVVEQHDVHPRTEELGRHHPVPGGVAADVLVPVPLMPQRPRHLDRHLRQQLRDRRLMTDPQPQRHDIRRGATRAAHRRRDAPGHRQAQDDLVGSGPLRQIRRERREQQARRRRVEPGHRGVQFRVPVLGQRCRDHPIGRGRRGRPPGQPGSGLEPGDLLRPVLAVRPESGRVAVGEFVLDQGPQSGDLRIRNLCPGYVGGVALGDPLHVHHRAEAVHRDVMRPHVPEPALIGQLQCHRADQPIRQHIQRAPVLRAHPRHGRGLRIRLPAQIHIADPVVEVDVDVLPGLTVALDDPQQTGPELAGGLQRRAAQELHIEGATQIHVLRDRDRHLGIQMLGIPDTELRRRQREEVRLRNRPGYLVASFAVSAEIQPVQPSTSLPEHPRGAPQWHTDSDAHLYQRGARVRDTLRISIRQKRSQDVSAPWAGAVTSDRPCPTATDRPLAERCC